MARRKNIADIEEPTVATAEKAENSITVEIPENEQTSEIVENKISEPAVKVKVTPEQEIPDNVKDILKIFSNYPELLVTPYGGVFVLGCKLAAAKAAILYKNPFYNT